MYYLVKSQKYDFKVLAVYSDYLFGSRGYRIYKFSLDGKLLDYVGTLEDIRYRRCASYKLIRRLLRVEITALYELADGALLAIAKKGFFRKEKGKQVFKKVFSIPRGSRPLNICFTKDGKAYFGEYFQNVEKAEVHIYGSEDGCKSWKIVHTFKTGSINHVHGLFHDHYTNRIWIVTGDRDNECLIGWTDDGFRTINEVFRGGQEYRTCQLFFFKDFIIYATDSQYIQNEIVAFSRETLQVTRLTNIQGSAIKGGQCGNVAYLSTTVEPSEVNLDKHTHVWVSYNGLEWHEIFEAEKDSWPSILQYATMEFPLHYNITEYLYFSGRAVRNLDGKTIRIKLYT